MWGFKKGWFLFYLFFLTPCTSSVGIMKVQVSNCTNTNLKYFKREGHSVRGLTPKRGSFSEKSDPKKGVNGWELETKSANFPNTIQILYTFVARQKNWRNVVKKRGVSAESLSKICCEKLGHWLIATWVRAKQKKVNWWGWLKPNWC